MAQGARAKVAGILLAAGLLSAGAQAQSLVGDSHAQTYLAHGTVNGCGLSFRYTWIDGETLMGVAGSMNYFVFDDGSRTPVIKIIASRNSISTLLKFAWFDIPGYGDTMKLTRVATKDDNVFSALSARDPSGALMASFAAADGFKVGVHFVAEPHAHTVKIPPAPDNVQRDLATCYRKLPDPSG